MAAHRSFSLLLLTCCVGVAFTVSTTISISPSSVLATSTAVSNTVALTTSATMTSAAPATAATNVVPPTAAHVSATNTAASTSAVSIAPTSTSIIAPSTNTISTAKPTTAAPIQCVDGSCSSPDDSCVKNITKPCTTASGETCSFKVEFNKPSTGNNTYTVGCSSTASPCAAGKNATYEMICCSTARCNEKTPPPPTPPPTTTKPSAGNTVHAWSALCLTLALLTGVQVVKNGIL